MKRLLIVSLVLLFAANIDTKVIPMSHMDQTAEMTNDIKSNNGVSEKETDYKLSTLFGPSQRRLEELYKIVMGMMIPCVNSLHSIEPIIRHNFIKMRVKVTEEEMTALMMIKDSPDFSEVANPCKGRLFGQPPLPWMT